METSGLYQVVNRMVPLEPEAFSAFTDKLTVRTLKKNEVLWNIGEVCKEVGFITRGGMRYFFYRDGEEVTGQFFFENSSSPFMRVCSPRKLPRSPSRHSKKPKCC